MKSGCYRGHPPF